ncbi:MAG: hypothetical protein WCP28_02095 [Actinomycetes bacterium]
MRTPPKTLKTAPLPAKEQQFAFVSGTRQSPVRWHTCAPMTWRINTGGIAELPRLNPPTVHLKVGSQSSPAMRTKLYLHELGHVMGLTHVTSRLEIMADSWNSNVTSFGPGDLNGLARLGVQAGCLLPPAAPTDTQITGSSTRLAVPDRAFGDNGTHVSHCSPNERN